MNSQTKRSDNMKQKIPSVAELIREHSQARYLMANDERFGTKPAGDSYWMAQQARELMVKQYA